MSSVDVLTVIMWILAFFIVIVGMFFIGRLSVPVRVESRLEDNMPMWYSKKVIKRYSTKNKGVF